MGRSIELSAPAARLTFLVRFCVKTKSNKAKNFKFEKSYFFALRNEIYFYHMFLAETKDIISILVIILLVCACNNTKEKDSVKEVSKAISPIQEDLKKSEEPISKPLDSENSDTSNDEVISTEALVLSVKEELIMPYDYLTTAMTVITDEQDTLVFLDMYEFEELVNQRIPIQYKINSRSRLLVCFDCSVYNEKIELYDITAFPSEVTFESLKLQEYIPNPYIDPASTFIMLKGNGQTEEFQSNSINMIKDSIKMAGSFYKYGVITKHYPELLNREELQRINNKLKYADKN